MTALLLASLVSPALACGGFFPPPGYLAASNTQEAIFTPGDGEVKVEYRVLATGDAPDFGWIIPIPGEFLDLQAEEGEIFRDLNAATDPREELDEVKQGGCLRGASKGGDNAFDTGGAGGGVDVVAEGFSGPWEYVALTATSSDALVLWLDQHGFDVGPSGPSLDAYVADGTFQFVAITLSQEIDEGVIEAPPVAIRYSGDRIVYPARMSRYSLAGTQHTILYVKGDQRARVSDGWAEADLPLVWDDGEDPDYMRYEAYPEAVADLGRDRGYAVTFAGMVDGVWVTRFETIASPEVHTADVQFAVDAGTAELHTLISNRGGCETPEGAEALLLPALVAAGAWGRRRARR